MRRRLRICRASAVAESEGRNPFVQHPTTQADRASAGDRGARGFALLVVLWTMGLLALLAAQFTSAGRGELRIAMNLQANATAQAAADGALYEAMFHLMQGTWMPDGRPRVVQVGGATVRVRAKNLAWKVNPNLASVPVLRALLAALGVVSSRAMTLAQAIADWRTPGQVSLAGGPKIAPYRTAGLPYGPANRPFDSVDELGLVIGMTPVLLARMKPFLSVYQEGDATDLLANPVQAAAEDTPLIGDGWQLGATGRVMVALIEADAASAAGGRFTRRAVVRLRAEPSLEQSAHEVLTWESGE
jgi:general secretion pathway protein K